MATRKTFAYSMDYLYFLTEAAHEYHHSAHDSGTGFLTCDRDLCVTFREYIRNLVNEAI